MHDEIIIDNHNVHFYRLWKLILLWYCVQTKNNNNKNSNGTDQVQALIFC